MPGTATPPSAGSVHSSSAMGSHRPFEHLQQCYFMGTTAEIVERIDDLRETGLQYLVIGLLDYDLEQVDRWVEEVIPRFA